MALAQDHLALSVVPAGEPFDLTRQPVETAMKRPELLVGLRGVALMVAFARPFALLLLLVHSFASDLPFSFALPLAFLRLGLLARHFTLPLAQLSLAFPLLLARWVAGDLALSFALPLPFVITAAVASCFAFCLELSVAPARTLFGAFPPTPVGVVTSAFFAVATPRVSGLIVIEVAVEVAICWRFTVCCRLIVVLRTDDVVEPFADRHAGLVRGLTRRLACFGAKAS